jgi:hypothetical protein
MGEFGDLMFEEICELFSNPVIEPAKDRWDNDGLVTQFLFVDMHDLLCFSR